MFTTKAISLLIFFATMAFGCIAHADIRLHLKYDEANGDPVVQEQVSGAIYLIRHKNNPPERVPGVSGNALRTDGYSTWLTGPLNVSVGNQMTISTWIALESYPSTEEGNHQASSILHAIGQNDFNLGIDTYGNWWFHVHIGGEARVVFAPNLFPLYEWTHVAATVNAGTVKLFINGVEQVSQTFPSGNIQLPVNGELVIGRSNQPQISHGVFEVNAMNAAYDETRIEAVALSQAELQSRYAAHQSTSWEPSIAVPESRFANDHLRPRYHAMPPANWTNEPHGLVWHDGRYHMFYQRTPNGPFKWMMHWGHMWSDDLVNWTNTKDAFFPRENTGGLSGLGSKGIWSGDVIMDNGWAHAFYTTVNYDGQYDPGIAWATNNDGTLENWTLRGGIIDKNNPNPGGIADFRDPYLWYSDGRWHMIIGAARHNGGGLEYYHTTHLGDGYWERANNFTSIPYSMMDPGSAIWEMPVFEYLGNHGGVEKWVLVVSPIGGSMQKNNAPYVRSVYWTGTWNPNAEGVGVFIPDYSTPKHLDVIHGHLSPSVTRQPNGELVALGIVDERTNSQMQNDLGWAHMFSLPVVWRLLEDGQTIGQRPHSNLQQLRDQSGHYQQTNLQVNGEIPLDFSSTQAELTIHIDPNNTGTSYGFYVAASPDMEEVTRIYYDGNNMVIDKTSSTNYGGMEEVGVYAGEYDEAVFGDAALA
jgi:sucrose-6-phosphate hydrolase SacC (GH32 family)